MPNNRIKNILERLDSSSHRAGIFGSDILLAVSKVLPQGDITSVETGCGKSTIMFSNLSKSHFVFAYDDRNLPDSSVVLVQSDADFIASAVTFVYGPTQKTLPGFRFPEGTLFDVILIDGPHGYPFPDLEYAILYPFLKKGGVLIVDDIHIPSIGNMFDTLRSDRMYDELGVFGTTGVLRRTHIDAVPADGDHWYEQNYNYSKFPLSMDKYHIDRSISFGDTVSLSNETKFDTFAVRGLERSEAGKFATTTDLSSTISFTVPKSTSKKLILSLEYRSVYEDAALGATVILNGENVPLKPSLNKTIENFSFQMPPHQSIAITLNHPNTIPEHDRGIRRYNFRRIATEIYSISVNEAEISTSKKTKIVMPFGLSRLFRKAH